MKIAAISLILAIVAVVAEARRQINAELSRYIVEENYVLQLDLLKFLNGPNLKFEVSTLNNTQTVIKTPLKYSVSTPVTFMGTAVNVISIKNINSSVLVITDGTATDLNFYYVHLFQEFSDPTKTKNEIAYQYKMIPKTNFPMPGATFCNLTVYSMAVVPTTGVFFVDIQAKCKGEQIITYSDVYLVGSIQNFSTFNTAPKFYSKLVTNRNLQEPKSRTLHISLISLLPSVLVRKSELQNNTGIIDIITEQDLPNENVNFTSFYTYSTVARSLKSLKLYSQDVFLGFNDSIVRCRVDITTLAQSKLKSVESIIGLTSMDILVTENHVDVHYSYEIQPDVKPSDAKRIRWDNFDYPFTMEPLNMFTDVPNIRVDNKIITVTNMQGIYVRRSSDLNNFALLPFKDQSQKYYSVNSDGTFIALLEMDAFTIYSLRDSAFLVISNPKTDTITVKASTQTGSVLVDVFSFTFKVEVWSDETSVYNTEKLEKEIQFLNETLTSEVLFSKNIPSSWFLGNLLKTSLSCEGLPQNTTQVYDYRTIGLKKLNFETSSLGSKNTFYLEMDSRLVEGHTIVVLQLELTIYFLKCLLSQNNNLKCRTIKKIKETDMIIEGMIINSKYFMYLTYRGYSMIKLGDQTSQSYIIMPAQGTCAYIDFMNYDMIGCSNFQSKTLDLNIIEPSGKVRPIYSKPGVYSTRLEYMSGTQYILLSNEYSIDIYSLRTTNVISSVYSNITKRADCQFKLCGSFMIVYSVSLNAFEQYDISDVYNPLLIQPFTNLTSLKLRLVPGATTKFEVGCIMYWPLIVTDESQVFALFINIGAPSRDLLSLKIPIGKYSYLSNYFVNAVSLANSLTTPRVIWSFMDTSSSANNTFFGVELDIYSDYLLEIEVGSIPLKGSHIPCTFTVESQLSKTKGVSIPFNFENKIDTTRLSISGTSLNYKEKVFELDMFSTVSTINLTEEYGGQPVAFYFAAKDEDYNKSIILKEKFNRDDKFSKLIKCSRESTKIVDFYVNPRNSFFLMTTEAVYKIKNGTNYYVQNYMTFSTAVNVESKISCRKLFVNDESNMNFNLCEQDKVPFLFASNWNSLKPAVILQKQLVDIAEITEIRDTFGSENEIYLFTKPKTNQLKPSTMYQKYIFGLGKSQDLEIRLAKQHSFPYSFLYVTYFTFTKSNRNITKTQDVYFAGIVGSNAYAEDTYIQVIKDYDNSELLVIGNFSLKEVLGQSYLSYFAPVNNFECKMIKRRKEIVCVIVQDRNMHYMVKVSISSVNGDQWKASLTLTNLFLNYGNQVPSGPVDFTDEYLTLVSARPSHVTGVVDQNSANLTKVYLLLYDIPQVDPMLLRNGEIKPVKISAGLPISSVKAETNEMRINILENLNMTFLYLISKSYFPFQTYRIEKDFAMDVHKNVESGSLEMTTVNHYSHARQKLQIYDKFMRILLAVGCVILVTIIVVFLWTYLRNRKSRSSTMQNFVMDQDNDESDNVSSRPTDEIPYDEVYNIHNPEGNLGTLDLKHFALGRSTQGRLEGVDEENMEGTRAPIKSLTIASRPRNLSSSEEEINDEEENNELSLSISHAFDQPRQSIVEPRKAIFAQPLPPPVDAENPKSEPLVSKSQEESDKDQKPQILESIVFTKPGES